MATRLNTTACNQSLPGSQAVALAMPSPISVLLSAIIIVLISVIPTQRVRLFLR